jgi:tripartite-type tricarboxylate transporter receptor subunit TctC
VDAIRLPRRKFLHLAAGAATLPAVSRIARAQAYPTRPVRIIIGSARLMGQWLSERLGQQFVIVAARHYARKSGSGSFYRI